MSTTLSTPLNRVATWSGKVRKSGKTKKNDKSQEKSGKNGGYLKKVRKKSEIFFK